MGFLDRAAQLGQAIATAARALQGPGGTEREARLHELDRLYQGRQYEGRGLAMPWDKAPQGAPRTPLRFQRPATQYDLPRVIVERPTALLFGEGAFPELSFAPTDKAFDAGDLNAWLAAIADEGNLQSVALCWSRMGASLGSAVLTWAVVEGEFDFCCHKAMHCTPTFHPRRAGRLIGLEKRYKFKKAETTFQDGHLVTVDVDYWHREIWDTERHVVFADAKVGDGKEPNWVEEHVVKHGFGFVPAAWVKNRDNGEPGDPDGLSLFEGLVDLFEDVDYTLTGKARAVRYNTDPEKVYTGLPMDSATNRPIAVGGGASTSLPVGADAKFLETEGAGAINAEAHVMSQRGRALEVSRVVMPDPERLLGAAKSGVALRMLFAPTLELVGELRQSYGRGLREVLEQIVRTAREGKLQQLGALVTPPPSDIPPGKVALLWGDYFEPTPDDIEAFARAAVALKQGGILDHETIVRYLAGYFGIRNVEKVLAEVEKEEADDYGDTGNARPPGATPPAKEPEDDPAEE